MKTWLILIYLAISVISSFSQKVAYVRTNEAGTPLPIQDAGIEEPEPEVTVTTHNKDSATGTLTWFWSFFRKKPERAEDPAQQRPMDNKSEDSKKGILAQFWSFMSKGTLDDQKMEAEPYQDPGIEESEHLLAIKWDSLNISRMNLLRFQLLQDTSAKENEDDTDKINIPAEVPKEVSHEEKPSSYATGGKEEDDGDHCLECLSATEAPTRNSTTAKLLTTTTEKMTTPRVPPRSNPWATCNSSTPEMERKVAAALTEFALNFYKRAVEFQKDSNIVFSPISISVILSNLLLGACDETKLRLETLLSYPEDVTCVHAALKNLQKSEALASASAIFYQPTLTLNDEFRSLSDKFYQSRIQHLTNDSHQDVMDINAWVSKNTDQKIKKLLDDLDSDVQMVLLNAVFLRAKWKTMFRKHTIKEDFYRPGLPPISVPMMTSKKYPVASFVDNSLQAKVGQLQLSHNMSLIIIMPRSLSQNLSEVEKRLDADVVKSVMSKLESTPFRPTIVTLPKFKVASSHDLISIVQRLDYGIFFDANLCGIFEDEEVAVTSAQHRAVLEINEEGVEAAAATVVSLARTANFFNVQQPFIFMVSKNNEFPVFLGRIHNPKTS